MELDIHAVPTITSRSATACTSASVKIGSGLCSFGTHGYRISRVEGSLRVRVSIDSTSLLHEADAATFAAVDDAESRRGKSQTKEHRSGSSFTSSLTRT